MRLSGQRWGKEGGVHLGLLILEPDLGCPEVSGKRRPSFWKVHTTEEPDYPEDERWITGKECSVVATLWFRSIRQKALSRVLLQPTGQPFPSEALDEKERC